MRWLLLLIFLLLARGSTYAQTDSIFIESGWAIKRYLISEIDGLSFDRTQNPLRTDAEEVQNNTVPTQFVLSQNFPNPFNPSTKIQCSLPTTGKVQVKIFDINGRMVKEIFSGEKNQGAHTFSWDGKIASGAQVATGVYLFTVQFNNSQLTKKIIYLK